MLKDKSASHGLKWGLMISAVYCLLIYLRYYLGAQNAGIFGLLTIVGYVSALVLLFICGYTYRKSNGSFLEMKEAFKTLFIAVLLFEFSYALFTVIYLKYIDPSFFAKFRLSTEKLMDMANQSQPDAEKILKSIDDWGVQTRNINMFDFLKTYLSNVGVSGLFALIYSFILKRKAPAAPDLNQA